MALQLVVNKSKGRSSTKKQVKKRKASTTKPRKYEKFPVKDLIFSFKFVEKNKQSGFLFPADCFYAFIPESSKKGDPDSS